MKKVFAFIMALFLIPIFSPEVFAAEEVWMTVSYYDSEGTFHEDDWNVNHKGWSDAVEKSTDKNYSKVTVTLHDNWYSDIDGQFTPDFINGTGFNWDAIYFPGNCNITVDLNGYSINRDLIEWEYNGEVMYIQSGANVTIKNGTISGGYSCNGGGGIHMKGGNVTLENVHIYSNNTEDDDGAGIYVDGGNLVMKGGSIYSNVAKNEYLPVYGGGIAVYGGTAYLEGVEIFGNRVQGGNSDDGGAAAVLGGKLTLKDCSIHDNYSSGGGGAFHSNCFGSELVVENCVIKNNFAKSKGGSFYIYNGDIVVKNSNLFGNTAGEANSDDIYHYEKSFRLINCYVEGSVNDRQGTLVWENRRSEKIDLTGSIVNEGNTFVIISIAAVVAVSGISLIIIKRKRREKAPEK